MKYLATIKNEGVSVMPWFIYVESEYATKTYACRFARRDAAERIAAAMNRAWEAEGRLYERKVF